MGPPGVIPVFCLWRLPFRQIVGGGHPAIQLRICDENAVFHTLAVELDRRGKSKKPLGSGMAGNRAAQNG